MNCIIFYYVSLLTVISQSINDREKMLDFVHMTNAVI